ncbi:MAG: antibiotic biosynthesis monooxygenase [Gammaproteobacteria bacterium RBG_16_66_13]|nr:MAG: antibiotic biosynthesis monooxygenase [Gammaproteobacteria bacterium RBG_16_66_13]
MHILLVNVHVKPESVEAFCQATLENARHSLGEPGVTRFDVLQSKEDPSRFTLIEVYRNADAPARHKRTDHYRRWNQAVDGLMAEPRTRSVFANVFPDDAAW